MRRIHLAESSGSQRPASETRPGRGQRAKSVFEGGFLLRQMLRSYVHAHSNLWLANCYFASRSALRMMDKVPLFCVAQSVAQLGALGPDE